MLLGAYCSVSSVVAMRMMINNMGRVCVCVCLFLFKFLLLLS